MRPHSSTATPLSSNLVSQFLTYIELEKGLSKNTIESYACDLAKLESWARSERKALPQLSIRDLRRWMVELARDWGLDARSIRRATSAARGFFRFLQLDRHIKASPAEGLYSPRFDQRLPRFLTEDEMERLLAGPTITTERGLRDRAILELLYSSGLRVSELIAVKRDDLDMTRRILIVTGKGRKQRLVPVGKSALSWIESYLCARRQNGNDVSPFLFVNLRCACAICVRINASASRHNPGRPLHRLSVLKLVTDYAKQAGLSDVSPHTLRHTFATHLIQHNADIRSVQTLLGHTSIDTTQIYTHITGERLRAVYDKHHPRSKQCAKSATNGRL